MIKPRTSLEHHYIKILSITIQVIFQAIKLIQPTVQHHNTIYCILSNKMYSATIQVLRNCTKKTIMKTFLTPQQNSICTTHISPSESYKLIKNSRSSPASVCILQCMQNNENVFMENTENHANSMLKSHKNKIYKFLCLEKLLTHSLIQRSFTSKQVLPTRPIGFFNASLN